MEKLTKENFWNALYEKYPDQVQQFCNWIDEYKKRVNWNMLFNSQSDYQNSDGKNAPAPKYHDLPIAMQWGIFQQFCAEIHHSGFCGVESKFKYPEDMMAIPNLIEEYFSSMKIHPLKEKINKRNAAFPEVI